MSPKQQRGEATVELVLDEALRLFAASGEAGLTVQAVTRASGVSAGSLYHHFGSIDGLVSALTARWLGRLLQEMADALAHTRTARTGVEALVRAYLAFVRDHPEAAMLLHSAAADRGTMARGRELRDAQEARMSPFAAWIGQHVAAGGLAPLHPALVESLVMGPVVGVVRRALSGIDDVDLEEASRVLPDRIWRSVAP
ncbi:TetR family transcriptional regulator [Kitasatospora sp. NE20-6]|uniref:TetR/AcrR family transcriptional regulator n=1 Tax=Kitasatospora sp. NE20-6 TaxID=2859066 RepID=UPI0034DCBE9A